MENEKKYGFLTSISMVMGIVIGCGIEFKADDVLLAVNGNIIQGILGFLIVGIGVLFGALVIAEYAIQDEEYTGIIGYSRKAIGNKFAYIVGWFSMTCYYPACIVVLAMVTGIYLQVLLGINSPIFLTVATLTFIIATFSINIFSPKAGGNVQIIFTIIKLIPLLGIGIIGTLFFTNNPVDNIATAEQLRSSQTLAASLTPLSALISIAFAFDGWIVATNIARELKGKKNVLSKALAIGTALIIIIYIVYFYGITKVIDPSQIMALGDAHTEVAAQAILGTIGGEIITAFVVISVYGGLNGLVLAYLRVPKNFAESGLIKEKFVDSTSDKIITKISILTCLGFVLLYFILQQLLDYKIIFNGLNSPFDLSALPIMINYIFYVILFVMVNKIVNEKRGSSRLYYLMISIIATITGLLVVYGTMAVNGELYLVFSLIIILLGIPFYNKQSKVS